MFTILVGYGFSCLPERFKALCMFLPPFWAVCAAALWLDVVSVASFL